MLFKAGNIFPFSSISSHNTVEIYHCARQEYYANDKTHFQDTTSDIIMMLASMSSATLFLAALAALVPLSTAGYVLEDDYSMDKFFSMFEFFTVR